jgi:hypothetical protein
MKTNRGEIMLWNTIKLECKKAICNIFFLAAILIGCAITFLTLAPRLQSYYHDMEMNKIVSAQEGVLYNSYMRIETLFSHWIGSDAITPGSTNYFFLFPLLIAIPFGWSYCAERRSGYVRNMVIRAGRTHYHLSKYMGLFLSGGLAMTIPLLFNFLLTAMFIPAVKPDPSYITSYGIISSSFLSMIFYTRPFLYVFLYLLIDFVVCGLIACLCFTVGVFVRIRIVAVLAPFFILLSFHYLCYSFVYTQPGVVYTELSPMAFLRPVAAAYNTNWLVVLLWGVALFGITFGLSVIRGRRHQIY